MSFSKEDLKLIYNSRKHAFKIVGEPYSVSKQSAYVAEMVRQMKERYKDCEKIPATTVQAASTQAILDRDPETDKQWFNRPNPENWKAVPDADFTTEEGRDKGVGKREITIEEYNLVEAARRRPKNGIEFDDRSATTPERRQSAIDGFLYSPGIKATELSAREAAVLKSLAGYQKPTAPAKPRKKGVKKPMPTKSFAELISYTPEKFVSRLPATLEEWEAQKAGIKE